MSAAARAPRWPLRPRAKRRPPWELLTAAPPPAESAAETSAVVHDPRPAHGLVSPEPQAGGDAVVEVRPGGHAGAPGGVELQMRWWGHPAGQADLGDGQASLEEGRTCRVSILHAAGHGPVAEEQELGLLSARTRGRRPQGACRP